MRLNGTKYELINKLPSTAIPVSIFAKDNNIAVGQVYIKYERYLNNNGKNPNYTIRCFLGSNYVIPC